MSYPLCGIPSGTTTLDVATREIFPEHTFTCSPPNCVQSAKNPLFAATTRTTTIKPQAVITLKEGIATVTGGTLTKRGKLITNHLYLTGGSTLGEHPLFYFSPSRFFPKIATIACPIINLTAGWQDTFFHWMYQILPRLELIDRSEMLYIDQSRPFQRESLKMLGLNKIIDASQVSALKSPEITIPTLLNIPTPRSCAFLRSLFLPHLTQGTKKRLYISREDAPTRRVANHDATWELLRAYGYEKVTLTGRPLLEQMNLFYNAESVVATHGAGLSHLAFCQPKTPVIELFHKNYVNVCYWHVAECSDLRYYHIFDTKDHPSNDPDIDVDLTALRKSLDCCHR